MIREVTTDDAEEICEIYNYYILNTIITFEEIPVTTVEMRERIEKVISKFPWIVYVENNQILGYAYANDWKSRAAYKNTVESTVYLKHDATGKKIGSKLYYELIERLKKSSYHVVIGGIALPNQSSVALHEKHGFEKVAHFNEIGFKYDKWIDVGYWQLIID